MTVTASSSSSSSVASLLDANTTNNNNNEELQNLTDDIVIPPSQSASQHHAETLSPLVDLEDRIHELETKMAVISRLLQQHRITASTTAGSNTTPQRCISPPPPAPSSPSSSGLYVNNNSNHHCHHQPGPPEDDEPFSSPLLFDSFSDSRTPYLESPALGLSHTKRPTRHYYTTSETTLQELLEHHTTLVSSPTANSPRHHPHHAAEEEEEAEKAIQNATTIMLPPQLPITTTATVSTAMTKTTTTTTATATTLQPRRLHLTNDHVSQSGGTSTCSSSPDQFFSPNNHASLVVVEDDEPITATQPTTTAAATIVPAVEEAAKPTTTNTTTTTTTIRSQWLDFLNHSFPVESTFDVDVQMQEFIRVPGCLENLFLFGFIICLDCYLTMLTVLPLRFFWSCLLLVSTIVRTILVQPTKNQNTTNTIHSTTTMQPWTFHRRHCYQLIQVLMIGAIYRYLLCNIAIGTLYHWIRGQAMIKLYVIAAMIETFDRLLSSLGQDCLDSLYWNTVHNPKSQRFLVAILVVLVYASLHTVLLLVHITTLNVALNNASDHTVLTLLISGNFAEVKSAVFKKYNKTALFKIAASDICERFKLVLFLLLVWLVHVSQDGSRAPMFLYGKIGAIVILSEILADWIKHAFICKFNFLKSRVYREYGLILAGDYTGIGHEEYNLDPTHAVVKRIGFAQIPLVGILLKMVGEMIKYGGRPSIVHMVMLWLILVAIKIALGTLLKRWALVRLQAAPEYVVSSSSSNHQSTKKNQ